MKLYSYWRSSAAYRVRIALNLKVIDYEQIACDLTAGEHVSEDYLATNPQGLVPALEHEGRVFTQSLAIIEYLDSIISLPRLLPEEPAARAEVAAMAQTIACEVHPLNNLRVTKYLRQELGQADAVIQAWYEHWTGTGFAALEIFASRHSEKHEFLYGNEVSIADACLVPQMYNARRFNIDLDAYPILVSVDAHMQTLPAVIAASPERQADAG